MPLFECLICRQEPKYIALPSRAGCNLSWWPEHPSTVESIARLVGHNVVHNWDNLFMRSVLYKLLALWQRCLSFGVLIDSLICVTRIRGFPPSHLQLNCRNITYTSNRVAHVNKWLLRWLSVLARMIQRVVGINNLARCQGNTWSAVVIWLSWKDLTRL